MINLTSMPAFGFETNSCNSANWFKECQKKSLETLRGGCQEELRYDDLDYLKYDNDFKNTTAKTVWVFRNIIKAVAYLPLIGTLLGAVRIYKAGKATNDVLPNKFNHIARGCIEFISMGALLLIPDLILTVYRTYQATLAQAQNSDNELYVDLL